MSHIEKLIDIMARLRDPVSGCPWDVEQDFASVAPYTVEEAYEVAAAIDRRDLSALREELGDLLLQVVFHARMAEEIGKFRFDDVAASICEKLVRRHPHVFGSARIESADAQSVAWEAMKASERDAGPAAQRGVLAGVALALPALARAAKLGRRAARVGFDWPDAAAVADKVREELREVEGAARGESGDVAEEIGDLLFAVANLARHHGCDAEEALRCANAKFQRRFERVEQRIAASQRDWSTFTADELDQLWNDAKKSG